MATTHARMRPENDFARIIYETGVVGYQSPHGTVYSLEAPNLSMADLLAKDRVSVQSAFRLQLAIGPDDPRSTG